MTLKNILQKKFCVGKTFLSDYTNNYWQNEYWTKWDIFAFSNYYCKWASYISVRIHLVGQRVFWGITNLTHSYIAGGSRDLAISSRTVPNRSWFFCIYLDMVISNDIKTGLIRVHLKVYGHFYRKWRDFGTLNHVIVDHPISKPTSPFDPPWSVYPIYSQK